MPDSTRMKWPYPGQDDDPWYGYFTDFVNALDASGFASRDDRQLAIAGGGTISWTGGVLTWSENIQVVSPLAARLLQITADSVTIEDGQFLYTTLVRAPTTNATIPVAVASQVPSNDQEMMLAVRIGNVLYWRNGTMMVDGAVIIDVGSSQGVGVKGEYDWVSGYSYTQLSPPIEETMGYGVLDGSIVGLSDVVFRATWNPVFGVLGSANIKLYDIGEADPPVYATPVLISTLTRTINGVWHSENALTVGSSPGAGQIASEPRMYELTVYQSSQLNDVVFVGSAGISLR